MEGWIKLYRKLIKWPHYKNGNTFRLFLHLLMTANVEDSKWDKGNLIIKRGQTVTSVAQLAHELGLTVNQIRTSKNTLKNTGEITIKTTNKFSVITVCKFDDYQANGKDRPQAKPQAKSQAKTQSTSQHLKNNKEDKEYIVVDDARARARGVLEKLLKTRITVESFCKNNNVTFSEFLETAEAVLAEWEFTQPEHESDSDLRKHLLSTIRIKIREQNKKINGNNRTSNWQQTNGAGREQRAAAYMSAIASLAAEDDARAAKIRQS